MRECRTSGSVRGALSNGRPYRDYEPHNFRWMLPRESWACCGGLHQLQGQAGRRAAGETVFDQDPEREGASAFDLSSSG